MVLLRPPYAGAKEIYLLSSSYGFVTFPPPYAGAKYTFFQTTSGQIWGQRIVEGNCLKNGRILLANPTQGS
jgi:hypothetical protein